MCNCLCSLSWCGFFFWLLQSVLMGGPVQRGQSVCTAEVAKKREEKTRRVFERDLIWALRPESTLAPTKSHCADFLQNCHTCGEIHSRHTPCRFFSPAVCDSAFGASRTRRLINHDWALWCHFRGIKHLLIKSIPTSLAQQCPTCRHCLKRVSGKHLCLCRRKRPSGSFSLGFFFPPKPTAM